MASGVLLIGEKEKRAIKAALDRARRHPVSLELIKANAIEHKEVVNLADRKPDLIRPASEHVQLGTYRASVSFEQQSVGLCVHLSVSSARPGKVPGPEVMDMVAREYGLTENKLLAQPWLEEFDPGHYAVNMVWLYVPAQEGNA